jgi:hypothetical protein
MSFDLKINHLCPHVQTEEMHVCESDGRRVILNDIMASTGPGSLRVKVNGVEWGRNNTVESPAVFDIGDEIAGLAPTYQMVLPEVPAMRGDQQGRFASSDQHVIIRACARERAPLPQLAERPKTFLVGQNQDAVPLYVVRATAHAWGLVRPKLEKATAPLADRIAILSRYDANPQIGAGDLLKNPGVLRPELERILSPRSDLAPWSASEILSRFDADPTSSTSALLGGLTVPDDIASKVGALIGVGREDAVFDVSDSARSNIEVALGAVRTQLERILGADAAVTPAQKSEALGRYDADLSLGGGELLDGITASEQTARRVAALLGDGRAAGTEWVEIPVTPRLPLLGRYDFVEGEVATSDVRAFVNGDQVEVAGVDGFQGVVTLADAPYPCDLVEFEYCWKVRLLFVSGENGVIAVDPHHLGTTSPSAPAITGADVRYFTRIKDGWSLSPNAGSIGGQYDIVFDTTKRTDKGRVILESLGQFANGYNTVFRTSKSPLLPFDADFFSDSVETLFNSAPLSVNGEIAVPSAFDPVLGLLQLDSPPAPGQDVRISYYYRMAASERPLIAAGAAASAPANPFEPDIVEVDYVTQRTNCHRCNAMGRLDDVQFSLVDGSVVLVRTVQKLKQDLYKIVGTVVGSNPFHRFYGTNFTIYIGQAGPPGFFRAQLTNEMLAALGTLQRLQNDQFAYQAEFIDRQELINAVQSVNVRQVDEIDPGIFQVDVTLLSDAANVVDARVLLTEEGVTLLDRAERKALEAIPQ